MGRMPTVVAHRDYLMHSRTDRGKYTEGGAIEAYRRRTARDQNVVDERKRQAQEETNKRYEAMERAAREERISKRKQGENLIKPAKPKYPNYSAYKIDQRRQAAANRWKSKTKDAEEAKRDASPSKSRIEQAGKTARNLERAARKIKMSKDVPSQNPTAGGGYTPVNDGKERAGHKYKAKVRTKSGKIRYIYDNVETASGKHGSIKDAFDSQKHAKHVSNKAAYMDAWKRREKSENAQRARNADPVNQVRKFANRTVRQVTRAAGGAIDAARGFLRQFGIG